MAVLNKILKTDGDGLNPSIGWLRHDELTDKIPEEIIARLHEGAEQEDNWSSYDCHEDYDIFYLATPEELKDPASLLQLGAYISKTEVLVVYTHWEDRSDDFIPALLMKKTTAHRAFLSVIDHITKNDGVMLGRIEDELTTLEEAALKASGTELLGKNVKISEFRRRLQPMQQMYEQLMDALEDLVEDENGIYSPADVKYAARIQNRVERLYKSTINLRDFVSQVREAYQTQIDIGLNDIMKVFTVLTAIFLPLTLMTSWYGMNFDSMKELGWDYGYAVFIGAFILVAFGFILFFKRKKWF
ncbi:MAG: hypothetical protein LBI38_05920 [Oscillospiraceae bacterium]|jgi:magnesium transporter|nr:hypothetical protein [Oscillospiraceae bacterium]